MPLEEGHRLEYRDFLPMVKMLAIQRLGYTSSEARCADPPCSLKDSLNPGTVNICPIRLSVLPLGLMSLEAVAASRSPLWVSLKPLLHSRTHPVHNCFHRWIRKAASAFPRGLSQRSSGPYCMWSMTWAQEWPGYCSGSSRREAGCILRKSLMVGEICSEAPPRRIPVEWEVVTTNSFLFHG